MSLSNRTGCTLAVAAIVTTTFVACKKNEQEPMAGGYQLAQTAGAAGAQAGSGATSGAGGTAGTGGSAGAAGTGAPAGPTAQKLDATAAAAVRPFLDAAAKEHTQAGAKPVGETLVGNFATGQTLDGQILLQPNKCYTVVATGLPPVTEVNVQLVLQTPLPGMTPVLAVDQDSGATAVLGKKATCYKWMFGTIAAPAKVVVQVTAGSGLVAAQTYEK